MIGQTLGHYRILEKIGAGGMGEVYRATDTRLGREVAIKVLPDAFARDPERLARFEQEARLLAALNHPSIAAIHGLEESDGVRYLVLELVPGETLADRISRGPLPVEEALTLCRQIAEALEAAHERGIIHRDLKPANIKVTPEGKVKVLDFGLAKAFAPETLPTDLSHSPTETYRGMSEGVILGTAAYMSPEQARGKPLDKRTDIWSFGCVLYEMLSGRQAFEGETISDTLAAILKQDPGWDRLPQATPWRVRDLLRHCLRKDPSRRLRDAGDARIEIEDVLASPAEAGKGAAAGPEGRVVPRPLIPWIVAGVAVVVAGIALRVALIQEHSGSEMRPVTRFAVSLPPAEPLDHVAPGAVALSPDGERLVYSVRRGAGRQLYQKLMDSLEAAPLPGTEGGFSPFFSPDGDWVGFFTGSELKKVPLGGGLPVTICTAEYPLGASWGPDDTIYFSTWPANKIVRVPAAGGQPQPAITLDSGETGRWPEILPDGKTLVFVLGSGGAMGGKSRIAAVSLGGPSIAAGRKILVEDGTAPRYLSAGQLVFARGEELLAVRFDARGLNVAGAPVPALVGVMRDWQLTAPLYSVSRNGTLAYVPGLEEIRERTLVWVDRGGSVKELTALRRAYVDPNLSPDGTRLAIAIQGLNQDVWNYDLGRGTLTRVTFEDPDDMAPLWTPDGGRIAYVVGQARSFLLLWKAADGSGEAERLWEFDTDMFPISWSPDGRFLAFQKSSSRGDSDIGVLQVAGERQIRPFLNTPFDEIQPQFSPDGRRIAYVSDESGRREVYVQEFPGPGRKWQISSDGGIEPRWARNGRELFYRSGDRMMAVAIQTRPLFSATRPRLLFEGRYTDIGAVLDYDVSTDGQRFLMIKPSEKAEISTEIHIVLNWSEELKRRLPARRN